MCEALASLANYILEIGVANGIDRREFLIAGGLTAAAATAPGSPWRTNAERLKVVNLKVDYLDCPLGLENRKPQLSWQLESDERNVRQGAYRILVASNKGSIEERRGDLWDSGKVHSRKSFGIPYQGRELTSRECCWWSVQVWDERGDIAAPSATSWWEMGLLDAKEWTAQWLAVEDAVVKADREAGLHWIWAGLSSSDKSSRKFRLKFELPVAAKGGEILAVTNDWHWWTQISRIWIDGNPAAGPGIWIDPFDPKVGSPPETLSLSRQQLTLEPLRAGKHLIAVEVNTVTTSNLATMFRSGSYVPGIALFARLGLQNGETLRIGSGTHCRTSLTQDDAWYTVDYDDAAWSAAQPAAIDGYQPWPAQPAMHLRREFSLDKSVTRARLYATALGAYEARLNGQRVGDALLTPEISQYAKRVLYRVFDVTSLLQQGKNVLGLTVGDGWYAGFDGRFAWAPPPRRVLAQLELVFADGSRQIAATGPGWRLAESPIQFSEIKSGEIYDARREQPGWDTVGFDDTHWQPAQIAEPPPCRVVAHTSPPIRGRQTFKPQAISQPRPGVYVVDFGENFSGWCRLRLKGSRGSRLELKFAEVLKLSGEVDPSTSVADPFWKPKSDLFTLKGDPFGESFEPHFSYRGFRYVEITGSESELTADSLEGIFVHSDLQITGRIRSDVALVEQIARNILQTQRTNFVGIPTDNATRELRGWMNDATGCVWDTACFNMDVCAFTARFMDNVVDDQADDGAFPMVTPEPRHNNAWYHVSGSPPGWGDTGIILPWTVWRRYGDLAIIERNWVAMNRYLQFILDYNPDLIWRNKRSNDFGDWLESSGMKSPDSLPVTPKDLLATAYWAHSADLLAQMSEAIGRTQDASRLRALFERIRQVFNQTFVKSDGTIGSGSQTCYVLALQFGLLPEGARAAAAERLAADIRGHGPALTTGTVGTQFLLDVLVEAGFGTLAYDLLLRTEYPSWGHMIQQGATTIWEKWDGTGARNQFAFGSIGGFLFRRVAGIDSASPGFETIVIRPALDSRVKRGGGDYDSIMGRISTDWAQISEGRFALKVTVPPNSLARIHLPMIPGKRVTEGRRDISNHRDLRVLDRSDEEVVLQVGSGSYSFFVGDH